MLRTMILVLHNAQTHAQSRFTTSCSKDTKLKDLSTTQNQVVQYK